jgi:hypothetical protein
VYVVGTFISRCFAIDGGLLYGGGFEKLGVQAIEYFQLRMGNGRFFYSSFHLEENGIKRKKRKLMV